MEVCGENAEIEEVGEEKRGRNEKRQRLCVCCEETAVRLQEEDEDVVVRTGPCCLSRGSPLKGLTWIYDGRVREMRRREEREDVASWHHWL